MGVLISAIEPDSFVPLLSPIFLVLTDSVDGFEAGTGRRDEQIMKPVVMVDKAV